MPRDWGNTPSAVAAREVKATKLARKLAADGYPADAVYQLSPEGRRLVEKAVGIPRACSPRTWDRVWVLLGGRGDVPPDAP